MCVQLRRLSMSLWLIISIISAFPGRPRPWTYLRNDFRTTSNSFCDQGVLFRCLFFPINNNDTRITRIQELIGVNSSFIWKLSGTTTFTMYVHIDQEPIVYRCVGCLTVPLSVDPHPPKWQPQSQSNPFLGRIAVNHIYWNQICQNWPLGHLGLVILIQCCVVCSFACTNKQPRSGPAEENKSVKSVRSSTVVKYGSLR